MIETLSTDSLVFASIPLAAIATDTDTEGASVAWGRFRSAMVIAWTGTITDGSYVVEVQDSDDDTTYTAVATALLEGAEPTFTDASSDLVRVIGYKGTRKYLRVVITSTDTTLGGVMGALIVCADAYRGPVAR